MGLFSFLKDKFSRKKTDDSDVYVEGMAKSRKNFAGKLSSLNKKYKKINHDYFSELEEILIEADVGVALTFKIIEKAMQDASEKRIIDSQKMNELVIDLLFDNYMKEEDKISCEIDFVKGSPTVLLVMGVNGVGKTTTIAKLAYRYINQNKKVMLVAADTFRAGAIEQLETWAKRLHCPIIIGKKDQDPASVAFEGAKQAKYQGIDLLIVDTAGRLQTKQNLMLELGKIKRVLGKEIEGAPHESFLVLDATTGQNGVVQARAFKEVTSLTGIVISKMDGTSKGGILLSIRDELGIPVRFIGLGEKMEDLKIFDLESYLYSLCIGNENE